MKTVMEKYEELSFSEGIELLLRKYIEKALDDISRALYDVGYTLTDGWNDTKKEQFGKEYEEFEEFCKSIDEFVEAAIAIYALENISFVVLNEPVKTTGEDVSKGEYAVEIIFSFKLDELQTVTASVPAYYSVLSDELCVRSVETSP